MDQRKETSNDGQVGSPVSGDPSFDFCIDELVDLLEALAHALFVFVSILVSTFVGHFEDVEPGRLHRPSTDGDRSLWTTVAFRLAVAEMQ